MSSPTLAEFVPKPDKMPSPGAWQGPHPAVTATGSALLLWASFPPASWGWLAWVALVPLFQLVVSRRSRLSLYVGSWIGGMVFWTLAIQWIRLTDPSAWLAWLTMATALSFFWPAFLALARLAVIRLRLPLMIAAPVSWVALEYVRAHIISGFPWYYLAHSQYSVLPLIQVADFAGSLGISVLIAVVNAWLVDLLNQPLLRPTPRGARLAPQQALRLGVVVVLLASTLFYGAYRLGTSHFRPGPRVLLLQSSLVQRLKLSGDANKLVELYRSLIERGLRSVGKERLDLIVWPETAYPFSYTMIDRGVDDLGLQPQVKRIAPNFTAAEWRKRAQTIGSQLHDWADQIGSPMLVGTITYDHRPGGHSKYNSAVLFAPGSTAVQTFHKMHLVPFGEYVPLVKTLPFLTALTPYKGDEVPSLTFGTGPTWFDVGPFRYASAICFEDTVPHLVRRFFSEAPGGRDPDVLVNLSNDGWFAGSSEHEMHLAVSVFRAIENRVPLARSANTGISAIIDGNGRVLDSLPTLKEGFVTGIVPLDDRRGYYPSWGDWVGQSCLAVVIGLVVLGRFWSRPPAGRLAN